MRALIDTNVLLRSHDESDARHAECTRAIDILKEQANRLYVCAQVLVEFWVVSTRPRNVNGMGLSAEQAKRELTDIRNAFMCLPEPPDMASRWFETVAAYSILGKPAHDARLVALMLAHNVTRLLTLNPGDFTRYQEIAPITPHEILQQKSV